MTSHRKTSARHAQTQRRTPSVLSERTHVTTFVCCAAPHAASKPARCTVRTLVPVTVVTQIQFHLTSRRCLLKQFQCHAIQLILQSNIETVPRSHYWIETTIHHWNSTRITLLSWYRNLTLKQFQNHIIELITLLNWYCNPALKQFQDHTIELIPQSSIETVPVSRHWIENAMERGDTINSDGRWKLFHYLKLNVFLKLKTLKQELGREQCCLFFFHAQTEWVRFFTVIGSHYAKNLRLSTVIVSLQSLSNLIIKIENDVAHKKRECICWSRDVAKRSVTKRKSTVYVYLSQWHWRKQVTTYAEYNSQHSVTSCTWTTSNSFLLFVHFLLCGVLAERWRCKTCTDVCRTSWQEVVRWSCWCRQDVIIQSFTYHTVTMETNRLDYRLKIGFLEHWLRRNTHKVVRFVLPDFLIQQRISSLIPIDSVFLIPSGKRLVYSLISSCI